MQKKHRVNNFLLLIIGFIFFLNPMIVLFDFIPDFIGCFLMMLALHRLACLASDFEDAFKYLKFMAAASGARLLISLISGQFDNVTYLSVSLILAVAEVITAYLMLNALCQGLDTLNYRFAKNEKHPSELRNIGVAFFVARGLCSMLPYVTSVLDSGEEIISAEYTDQTANFVMLLMLVNITITVIFAVFFAITVLHHLSPYVKNQEVKDSVSLEISERNQLSPEFFIRKNLTFCLTLLAFCSVFLVDFLAQLPVGGMNFIPDFIFGGIAVWVVLLLRKQLSGYIAPLVSGMIYTVLSCVSYFVYNDFLSRHFATDFSLIIKSFFNQYIKAVIFAGAETVSLIVFAILLVRYLMPLAVHYSICDYTAEFVRLGQKTERERVLNRRLIIGFGAFLCVIALSGSALVSFFQIFDIGYDDINFPYLLAHILLHVAFYAYTSTLFLRLRAGVVRRYTDIPSRRD